MSLIKAIGYGATMFVMYTIGGVFCGAAVATLAYFACAIVLVPFGYADSPVAAGGALVIWGCALLVSWANAWLETQTAIRERPRGLGLRQRSVWKDGAQVKVWEKY